MKYVVILGDGMADWEIEELGGKTPLSYADTPTMDALAASSQIGIVKTIPDGMAPGSDTANLLWDTIRKDIIRGVLLLRRSV